MKKSITNKKPTLIVITGPTAVGKTRLCVEIAKYLNTEIISADSRQFFKELSIGTAKPTTEEMQNVPHHFVDFLPIKKEYNVSDYEKDVLSLLNLKFKERDVLILTGGSGLYIDAICTGFDEDLPQKDKNIRKELEALFQKYGIELLQKKLLQLDPTHYKKIDLNNKPRLERAIEACVLAQKPFSKLRKGIQQERPFKVIKIGLKRDNEELFNRINQRVDRMMQEGLLEEAKKTHVHKNSNALKTVGYVELFEYLDEYNTLEEAVEKIKVNTRRYAKKQMAWFNRAKDYRWFHPDAKKEIMAYISSNI